MPPKLISDNKQHIVIRPLAYCRETDLDAYSNARQFPIIPCNLCGSQENLQRKKVKQMLRDWDLQQPGRVVNVFKSMARITPSHLLDRDVFNFSDLSVDQADQLNELDIAFDESPMEVLLQRSQANAGKIS